jgi:hypothetical protein
MRNAWDHSFFLSEIELHLLKEDRSPFFPEVKQIKPAGRKTDRAFHPAVVAEFHSAPTVFAGDATMRFP